jgi:oligopeptide/dipeptide ABC transporter ATP-binding protein
VSASAASSPALLELRDLVVKFPVRAGAFARSTLGRAAVDGVSFDVARGETLALVGESGSGKTTLGRALLRLVEPNAGRVLYRPDPARPPRDLLALSASELREVRRELAIVFQDPLSSLNPRFTVGDTLREPLEVHLRTHGSELEDRVDRLLARVGLPIGFRRRFPHELSGGERQRVAIARALALGPRLVVCDEALSALDVSLQVEILSLLEDLQAEHELAYLFIAHDLSLVRRAADRALVMYDGRIVERGTIDEIFDAAAHPYTRELLASMPRLDELVTIDGGRRADGASASIAEDRSRRASSEDGAVRESTERSERPTGCRFHPRCPLAEARCREIDPAEITLSPTHRAACHLVEPP